MTVSSTNIINTRPVALFQDTLITNTTKTGIWNWGQSTPAVLESCYITNGMDDSNVVCDIYLKNSLFWKDLYIPPAGTIVPFDRHTRIYAEYDDDGGTNNDKIEIQSKKSNTEIHCITNWLVFY